MKAVHLSPTTGAPLWPLSVEAYHALGQMGLIPDKTELIHGFVYHKMPKSPLHTLLLLRLAKLLQARIPTGQFLRTEQPLTLLGSEPEPDLSVVVGALDDFPDHHPTTADLVVEVCVTSHEYDRAKLVAYSGAGVKEVWFVLGPEKSVEVFRQPTGDRYLDHVLLDRASTLSSPFLPGFSLPLADLFPA
jgi:Uma2 family endonuclease